MRFSAHQNPSFCSWGLFVVALGWAHREQGQGGGANMMPGETHSKTAGLATEGPGLGCQNCSVLQQNLNEYAGAFVALKQKIIETDHLLTKYQQKCDELQVTERENSTLRHQLEQMLQKIATHDHCLGELESLQSELEEKKSSLKIYQDIQEEYIRIKEEFEQSDFGKKKLEARVKKLEDAAVKHNSDMKQLKAEKKTIEKELKKTQEKLEELHQERRKKRMKHAVTQFTSEEPVVMVDKKKIKHLLEELWVCLDVAAQEQKNIDVQEKSPRKRIRSRKSDYILPPSHSSLLETSETHLSERLTGKDNESEETSRDEKNKSFEDHAQDGDSAFYDDRATDTAVQKDFACSSLHCSEDDDDELGEKLRFVLNWARPLPPLLSPVQLSPSRTQDALFGEITDSSNDEIDCGTSKGDPSSDDGALECQINCTFVSGQEKPSKDTTTKEGHSTPLVQEHASINERDNAVKVAKSLPPPLDNLETVSIEQEEFVNVEEQALNYEPTSALDSELMHIKKAQNMALTSNSDQSKTSVLTPSQEKAGPVTNKPTHHENGDEKSSKELQSEGEACMNDDMAANLQHNSEHINALVESKEITCKTVDSSEFEHTSEILAKGAVAIKDTFSALENLSEKDNNVFCANQERLPIPDVSEDTFQTCVTLDSKKLIRVKENTPCTTKALFSQENPFKSKVGEDTKNKLDTDISLFDPHESVMTCSCVIQDQSNIVGTEIDCKMLNSEGVMSRYLLEHSYACLAEEDNVGRMITDQEISGEPDSRKDEMESNTVSVEVTASNAQKLEAMFSDPVIFNEQGTSGTENIVKSSSSITPTTVVFSEENASDQRNKPSTKYSLLEIENDLEKCPVINSKAAVNIYCIEPETAEVASVASAGQKMHCANFCDPKSLSNPVEISKSLESEQKCVNKIEVNTKDDIDMCKLSESQSSGLSVQLMELQTTSSVTSEQDCKNLKMELGTKPKSEFHPQTIVTKNTFEPLASDKKTYITKTLIVEPKDPSAEAGTSVQPQNVCVSNEIKAQTESDASSQWVCCTGKPAFSLSKSTGKRACETFEKKAEVDNCVTLTVVSGNVFPLEQAETNYIGSQISHSDLARKINDTRRDSKLNQSCSTDGSIAPPIVSSYREQCAVNAKVVIRQVANLEKGGAPCIDHDSIAMQFAIEASECVKKIQSKNIVVNSVNQTSAKSAGQQCICIVNSEKDVSPKHESCCCDGRVCDKADTFTDIVPSLNKQVVVDAQVDNSTGSEQPSCSGTEVIPEKDQEFSSCKHSGTEQEGNHSDMFLENTKHFKTEQNHLSFSVLCRRGTGTWQNTFNTTSLPKDVNKEHASVNMSLNGSEEIHNMMKGRHASCPEENIMYPDVPSFRSARNPTGIRVHDNTPSPSTVKLMIDKEDSDLEDDFPVRKVSNTNRHIYRKPNRKKYMDDMLKLTKMMQHVTTANDQEDSKMTPSLNADKRFKAQHLTAVSLANAAFSELKHTNHLSGIIRTKAKCDQQAVCSFEATSLAPNSLTECSSKADHEETLNAKIVNGTKASLTHSIEANRTAPGKLAQCLTEDSVLERGSVQVQMLADHVHVTGDFEVENNALTTDLTLADTGINATSGTQEIESEPQREHHQTPGAAPFCQSTDGQGLDLSGRKMEQSFLSSSVEECNRVKSHAVQPNVKAGSSGQHCIWNIPTIDHDLKLTKYKKTIDLRSPHRTLLPEFFSMCKSNVNNTLSNKITETSSVLPNGSGMTVSKAHNSEARFRIAQGRGKVKGPLTTENQPIVANADTSTKTKHSPDTISKVRSEMGPPLPPLLQPLIATPPRTLRPVSPIMSTSSRSSLPSPLDDLISPLRETPVAPLVSPLSDDHRYKSLFTTPSPSERFSKRIVSSPLQFCAATPKHALPVPGRLPPSASGKVPPSVPQENSVRILDSMYPELSAQARTLNILKGNIQLNRCSPADCKHLPGPVNTITGFKAITSTSTAFVKTGKNSKFDGSNVVQQDVQHHQLSASSLTGNGKRATMMGAMPRSAKRLCLGIESPNLDTKENVSKFSNEEVDPCDTQAEQVENSFTELSSSQNISEANDDAVNNALMKIGDSCFDLLPVINSHVHVGNISMTPIMRDEEKEVVNECTVTKMGLAEPVLRAIVKKLKGEMSSLEKNHLQALCRVYVAICRQLGDLERARIFCYNILKEDFPESAKLTLFTISVWQEIFSLPGVVNKAMQSLIKQRAKGDVLTCLTAYLKWEKVSPLNVGIVLSSVLVAIQLCPNMKFQLNEEYGEDLSDGIWQYVYAIDLLCCHRKWVWTHDNVISKELWPIMDKWVKYKKGCLNVTFISDITVAAVLRLIGRLSQIGLKEGFVSAVKNISSVISTFISHAKEEDMPWEVQLASIYALCDMASGDPAGVLETLQTWRRITTNNIPPAVLKYIEDISSLCMFQN
ncbi:little elongation complex subunit 1 [Pleurodeles waltl]|uniref:little elongation complex subunit 1 n=1 Tax=Pleurodeles waltl TaxID=8319 RepID=UPI0037096EB3